MCSTTSLLTPSACADAEPTWTKPARASTFAEPVLCSATCADSGLVRSIRLNASRAAEAKPRPQRDGG